MAMKKRLRLIVNCFSIKLDEKYNFIRELKLKIVKSPTSKLVQNKKNKISKTTRNVG